MMGEWGSPDPNQLWHTMGPRMSGGAGEQRKADMNNPGDCFRGQLIEMAGLPATLHSLHRSLGRKEVKGGNAKDLQGASSPSTSVRLTDYLLHDF